jgi:CubicO group peptidase (beta-lactamase class C family)
MRLVFMRHHRIVGAMLRKPLLLALAAVLLLGTSRAKPVEGPMWTAQECEGLDLSRAQPALDALFNDHPETRAVALTVNGCQALKVYAPGYGDQQRFISWSMAKSVTAMLAGELVADGRLKLDEPVPIAEWRGTGDPHRAITLRHLLHMASGVRHIEVDDPVENSDTNQTEFVGGTAAMAAAAIAQPVEVRPGSRFEYNTLTSILLSEVITRALTASRDPRVRAAAYRDFAQTRLFGPAGVRSAVLDFDGAGTQVGGSLIFMTLDDWSRMGALLLDGKGPDGRQVIAPEWLGFMKTPSPRNREYGGHVWLNYPSTARAGAALFPGKGPDTTVSMNGHLGQFVMAAQGPVDGKPRRLVLVRLGNTPDAGMEPLMSRLGDIVEAVVPRGGRTLPNTPVRVERSRDT